jgi:hypothetical protein
MQFVCFRWHSCRTGPSPSWTCTLTIQSPQRMLGRSTSAWNTTSRTQRSSFEYWRWVSHARTHGIFSWCGTSSCAICVRGSKGTSTQLITNWLIEQLTLLNSTVWLRVSAWHYVLSTVIFIHRKLCKHKHLYAGCELRSRLYKFLVNSGIQLKR